MRDVSVSASQGHSPSLTECALCARAVRVGEKKNGVSNAIERCVRDRWFGAVYKAGRGALVVRIDEAAKKGCLTTGTRAHFSVAETFVTVRKLVRCHVVPKSICCYGLQAPADSLRRPVLMSSVNLFCLSHRAWYLFFPRGHQQRS